MGALSPILRGTPTHVMFFCPGCKSAHGLPVADTHDPGRNWFYNGNPNAPTFRPSVLVRSGHHVPGHDGGACWCNWEDKDDFPEMRCTICHSWVTDGQIQFLDDCTHDLRGQTVAIPEWPADYGDGS